MSSNESRSSLSNGKHLTMMPSVDDAAAGVPSAKRRRLKNAKVAVAETVRQADEAAAAAAAAVDDELFDPTAEMLVNAFDDERTLDEEESIAARHFEDESKELSDLQKESEMPIEQLLAMYGYNVGAESEERESSDMDDEDGEDEEVADADADAAAATALTDEERIVAAAVASAGKSKKRPRKRQKKFRSSKQLKQFYAKNLSGDEKDQDEDDDDDDDDDDEDDGGEKKGYADDEYDDGLLNEYNCKATNPSLSDLETDNFRRKIMVGSAYQAQIPDDFVSYDDCFPYENEDKLLWDPKCTSRRAIKAFLKSANALQLSSPAAASDESNSQANYDSGINVTDADTDTATDTDANGAETDTELQHASASASSSLSSSPSPVAPQSQHLSPSASPEPTAPATHSANDTTTKQHAIAAAIASAKRNRNSIKDNEDALHLLYQCDYNADEALRRLKITTTTTPPTSTTSTGNAAANDSMMSLWSQNECENFEEGLRLFGKDFHQIQQKKVRTRSVSELVQFYYLWKKSNRYDSLMVKERPEKRHLINSESVNFMDKFLNDEINGSAAAAVAAPQAATASVALPAVASAASRTSTGVNEAVAVAPAAVVVAAAAAAAAAATPPTSFSAASASRFNDKKTLRFRYLNQNKYKSKLNRNGNTIPSSFSSSTNASSKNVCNNNSTNSDFAFRPN